MIKHKILAQKMSGRSDQFRKSVLLIDPGKNGGTIYGSSTNLGLFVLAEAAKRSGWHAEVANLGRNGVCIENLIAAHKPTVVGITSTSPGHAAAIELAYTIGQIDPSIILLKGGPHETYSALRSHSRRDCLIHNGPGLIRYYPIDISFIGEADNSFPAVLESITNKSMDSLCLISGICFKDESDTVVSTSDRPVRIAPHEFVLPSRVELEEPFSLLGMGPMVRVQSMRGCGFGCEFCAITGRARRVDPKTFIEYLESLVRSTGAKSIFFEDATFTLGEHPSFKSLSGWVRKFCELFKRALPKVIFGIQTRADCLNKGVNAVLYAAGCRSIYIGVETLSNTALKTLNTAKKDTVQIEVIRQAKEQGIRVTASLICDVGHVDEFTRTVRVLRDLRVDEIFMEAEKIFPGTGLASRAEQSWLSTAIYPEKDAVLAFYDGDPSMTPSGISLQVEDRLSILVSEPDVINRRYAIAESLLNSDYRMVAVGHWIRK